MEIRPLDLTDGPALYDLWLRGAAEYPEAFGATPAEFGATSAAEFAQSNLTAPERFLILGALAGQELVGFLAVGRNPRAKLRHSLTIGPVYVRPDQRRRGIARMLLERSIGHARGLDGAQVLKLMVAERNRAARAAYEACGFQVYGVEPKGMQIGDQSIAMALYALDL
jgi:ribosomal protein S18 acetylase RimI-like enzyme